jgi:tRNA threonylcarbamoyladenosine biosynthesis protein TsaB
MSLKILALDTSTDACSAALLCDGQFLASFRLAPRQHSALILPLLESLLTQAGVSLAQLDAIAFGCGPGSFTGVRLAASVTQGIAFAQDKPVVAVSTLRALAQGAQREFGAQRVLSSLDAYMEEVYWGVYQLADDGAMTALMADAVCAPSLAPFAETGRDWLGIGSGWDKYAAALESKVGAQLLRWQPNRYPAARDIAALAAVDFMQGKAVSAELALPVYLRDPVYRLRQAG